MAAAPSTLGEDLLALGWRGGKVVPHPSVAAIAEFLQNPGQPVAQVNEADWLVVVSQSCDVVAVTIKQEPYIEVLHCKPIPKLRRQNKELRSTRLLDFRPNPETHPELVLAAHASADRYLVPRDLFAPFEPDTTRRLEGKACALVSAWYSLRYGRPAWPNNFNNRLVADRLEDILEPLSDEIAEVRVSIAEWDQELGHEAPYRIAVHFVVDQAVWDGQPEQRMQVYQVFAAFVSELASRPGIEVMDDLSGPVSGAVFTWQQMQMSDQWNFANLSHRD